MAIAVWFWSWFEVTIRYNEKWVLCSLWNKARLGKRLHTYLSVRIVLPSLFTATESYCAVSLPHCDTVRIHSICPGFLSLWNCIVIVMVHNSYIISFHPLKSLMSLRRWTKPSNSNKYKEEVITWLESTKS